MSPEPTHPTPGEVRLAAHLTEEVRIHLTMGPGALWPSMRVRGLWTPDGLALSFSGIYRRQARAFGRTVAWDLTTMSGWTVLVFQEVSRELLRDPEEVSGGG